MEHEPFSNKREGQEKQNIPQWTDITMPASSSTDDSAVPPTLLSGILQRLEQREAFLATHHTTAELLDALMHPQWEIRAGAVRILGERGEQVPLAALITALHDEHRMVRLAAVRALSKQEKYVPLVQLAAALHDSDWEVREVAEQIAEQLQESLLPSSISGTSAHGYGRGERKARSGHDDLAHNSHATVAAFLRHCWHVFAMQTQVLPRSWWLGTALVMLLSGTLALIALLVMQSKIQDVALLLALFTTISAAAGSAFLYGPEHDEGFELMLATPISIRLVMLCRFVWVVGYNLSLSMLISALVALLHGGGFWTIMQFWLAPMLLIASFSLTLSLLIGSWLSLLAGILLEASQVLRFTIANHMPALAFNTDMTWLSSPLALLLAALCLCIALYWLPRTRLANAR
jgi:hypothetical protein